MEMWIYGSLDIKFKVGYLDGKWISNSKWKIWTQASFGAKTRHPGPSVLVT